MAQDNYSGQETDQLQDELIRRGVHEDYVDDMTREQVIARLRAQDVFRNLGDDVLA